MNRFGFYKRALIDSLQDTPLAPRKEPTRRRSRSVVDKYRRYLDTDNPMLEFASKCQRAFNISNRSPDDWDDNHLLEYKESLSRISYLDLDSTLADEHRLKGWLPNIKCRKVIPLMFKRNNLS